MGFFDSFKKEKKNLPVKVEKGSRDLVEKKENHEIKLEYTDPPWMINSLINKRRVEALADLENATVGYYNALRNRHKSWERFTGPVLEHEILAEKKEAELRALEAVEAVGKKRKFIKERMEVEELKLKVEKAELQQRLNQVQENSGSHKSQSESAFDKLRENLKNKLKKQEIYDEYHIREDIQKLKTQFKGKKVLETVLEEVWDEYIQGKPVEKWTEEDKEYYETLEAIYNQHKTGNI